MVITLILFTGIGAFQDADAVAMDTAAFQAAIASKFTIGWWLYLVPLAVVGMIYRKVPALPALFVGALLGGLFAVLFQPQLIRSFGGEGHGFGFQSYKVVISAMGSGVTVVTGNATMDELLTTNGMYGMLKTIWLVLCAMVFGGAMEAAGLLQRITGALISRVRNDGSLIATTAGSCIFINATASDQYLSIVLPGRMFAPVYKSRGLDPKVLSRTLEDSGTVTSALVPWNTCGAYMGSVLGVATLTYLPFCFFNLLSPLMTVVQGAVGFRIARLPVPPKP
jgi:NhaC family Na+:H+ antiporter